MWSIRLEIETDDPELKNQILSAIDAWQPQCDNMKVRTREELPSVGRIHNIERTSSSSFRLESALSVDDGQDEAPRHHQK